MDFDNFIPESDKNVAFRNLDVEHAYDVYKLNRSYFDIEINSKLFTNTLPYCILRNQFPYYWKNAKHYVLWINPIFKNFYNQKRIIGIIKNKFINKTIKYWENSISNRSILTVKHYHIIEKI